MMDTRISSRALAVSILVILMAFVGINRHPRQSLAADDDALWWIFLLNVHTYELTRVNGDGTVQSYALGSQADEMFEQQFAVSPDGSVAVYCILTMVELHTDDDVPFMTLVVYDLEMGATRFEVDLGASDGCRINRASFSEDGALVGVGLITPTYDAGDTAWRVPIVDLQTGEIVHEINADDALVAENSELFTEIAYFMPEISHLSATDVVFNQLSWRTEGGYFNEAVRWNWEEDTLTAESDRNYGIWIPETGELIWVDVDENLPLADPQAPIAQRNVVRVRGEDGETRTLFFTGEQVVQQVMLINSGRELLIRTYDGFDPDNPTSQESHWIVLDRDGNTRELEIDGDGYTRVLSTPHGYVAISEVSDGVVAVVAYENGEARVLWETDDMFRMVVGLSPIPVVAGLEPFVGID